MTIGWGIIGIGAHADSTMAPALGRAGGTKFVSVCSRNMERAKVFAAKHKAARAFDSLEKMLADPELNVLYIATPNNLHTEQTIQAAEAGKHVLCEKPMALAVRDAEAMIKACKKNKVKLGVCYQNRYHPAHIEARRYVQSGAAGDIKVVKAQYCRVYSWKGWRTDLEMSGAGALMGQGLHCVDLLRYIMDTEVTEVRTLLDDDPPRRPVDDMFYAILKFKNGAQGTVIAGIVPPRSDNDAVLYGSKAKVTCKGTVGRPVGSLGELLVDGDSLSVKMAFPTDEPLYYRNVRAIEGFNKWIEADIEPYITGYNGMQMVGIANAIIESSRQGRAIKIEGK